jgi:hypothetical protein
MWLGPESARDLKALQFIRKIEPQLCVSLEAILNFVTALAHQYGRKY